MPSAYTSDCGGQIAVELLGRRVLVGARKAGAIVAAWTHHRRDAEVEQDGARRGPAAREEDVGGFHVAVDHVPCMRVVEGVEDVDRQIERLPYVERPAARPKLRAQRVALEQLHHEKWPRNALGSHATIGDPHDVRMAQLHERTRLVANPGRHATARDMLSPQDLHRRPRAQECVLDLDRQPLHASSELAHVTILGTRHGIADLPVGFRLGRCGRLARVDLQAQARTDDQRCRGLSSGLHPRPVGRSARDVARYRPWLARTRFKASMKLSRW